MSDSEADTNERIEGPEKNWEPKVVENFPKVSSSAENSEDLEPEQTQEVNLRNSRGTRRSRATASKYRSALIFDDT